MLNTDKKNNYFKYILLALVCLILIIVIGRSLTRSKTSVIKKELRKLPEKKIVREKLPATGPEAVTIPEEKAIEEEPVREYTPEEMQKRIDEIVEAQYKTFSRDIKDETHTKATKQNIYPSEEELKKIKERKVIFY